MHKKKQKKHELYDSSFQLIISISFSLYKCFLDLWKRVPSSLRTFWLEKLSKFRSFFRVEQVGLKIVAFSLSLPRKSIPTSLPFIRSSWKGDGRDFLSPWFQSADWWPTKIVASVPRRFTWRQFIYFFWWGGGFITFLILKKKCDSSFISRSESIHSTTLIKLDMERAFPSFSQPNT